MGSLLLRVIILVTVQVNPRGYRKNFSILWFSTHMHTNMVAFYLHIGEF